MSEKKKRRRWTPSDKLRVVLAGLVACAMSMAAGEYVSVSSQAKSPSH